MQLGEKIQLARKKKAISQEDLANLLNVSKVNIQSRESKITIRNQNEINKLNSFLDQNIEEDNYNKQDIIKQKNENSVKNEEDIIAKDKKENNEKEMRVIKSRMKKEIGTAILFIGWGMLATIVNLFQDKFDLTDFITGIFFAMPGVVALIMFFIELWNLWKKNN